MEETANIRASTFKDHSITNMHTSKDALWKQSTSHATEFFLVVAALVHTSMESTVSEHMKHKYRIAYTISKNNLALAKM